MVVGVNSELTRSCLGGNTELVGFMCCFIVCYVFVCVYLADCYAIALILEVLWEVGTFAHQGAKKEQGTRLESPVMSCAIYFLFAHLLEQFVEVGGEDDLGAAVDGFVDGIGVGHLGGELAVTTSLDAGGVDAGAVLQ